MQVTDHIHALKIPFKLLVRPGKMLDRFVYAYLIYGDQICLIDSGVSGSEDVIFDYVTKTGRDPREISRLVFTHSHPDHIGASRAIKEQTACKTAAHTDACPWIEDVGRQNTERPIANFNELVAGSVKIDIQLKDGDRLDLRDGSLLEVTHTPGHSQGSICLLFKEDGALITGDAVPKAGTVPIYEDVLASIESLHTIKKIKAVDVLMASWDVPRHGARVEPFIDEGLHWFQHIHDAVLAETSESDSSEIMDVSARVLKRLGFPESALIPIIIKSIEAHIKLKDRQKIA
jgi:glyoxylase-like metal-dependent hydrolase (beta-lactamase superfamily II)